MKMTYRDVGIDREKIKNTHKMVEKFISTTHRFKEGILSGYGHYAGLIEIENNKVLALHTDGVGTKVLVAQMARRFDTIGIDCVAMNVNDVICVGAEPLAFVDYIAIKKPNKKLTNEIMKGFVKGAREANVAIVGGETAVIPEIITGNNHAFDLAGTVIGIVEKGRLILGDKIKISDVIVGVESNGLHSNGFSLARNVLLKKYSVGQKIYEINNTLAKELLKPTRIYVKPIMEILNKMEIHGLAHITGGAFTKLTRLHKDVSFKLDNMPEPQSIFKLLKTHTKVSDKEMYSTFNMGIGFCVIVPDKVVDNVIKIFKKYDMKSSVIGKINNGKGVYIDKVKL
ncbi:MAG: phosphoribosylformylglycinamidine cyclo-ligase [Thaumarchaeota archaeon]|nr:phosphoribosylformylglycinamidine cyclo-ligase [Nitrososphaerota archaeon]